MLKNIEEIMYIILTLASLPILAFILLSRRIKSNTVDITWIFSILAFVLCVIINYTNIKNLINSEINIFFILKIIYWILIASGWLFIIQMSYSFAKSDIKFSLLNYYTYLKENT